jgi:excisionase family DNA binding protein
MARDIPSNPPAARSFTRRQSDRLSPSNPAWLTVSQLCDRWQLGRKTVYKFISAKALPAWKVGLHLYRIAVADVLRFETKTGSLQVTCQL